MFNKFNVNYPRKNARAPKHTEARTYVHTHAHNSVYTLAQTWYTCKKYTTALFHYGEKNEDNQNIINQKLTELTYSLILSHALYYC
jgi:hypothetical protein